MKKKYVVILVIILILTATLGLSVAFFSYVREGNTQNSVKVGDLTFKYTEINKKGNGISFTDAYPISDSEGKKLEQYFDFKVEGKLTRSDVEYNVIVDTTESTIPDAGIKVYLVELVNGEEVEISNSLKTLSQYNQSTDGRIIYSERILRNTKNYYKEFRLRIWLDENVDWTDDNYINKVGKYRVNVEANSNSSMASTDVVTGYTTTIERIVANNMYLFTPSNDVDVDYEVTVPYTVNNVEIEVYESNTNSTSTITKLNSLNGVSTKLTNQNIVTGNNYFKTIVTSSNGEKTQEYILKVVKEGNPDNNLLSLGVTNYSLTPTFDKDITNYTLQLEEPSITITGNKSSDLATITGLGEKTLEFGSNVFNIGVTAENNETKTYTITVNNVRPTPPIITGGTGSELVTEAPTITLANNNTAFAISGIDHYEVYVASDNTLPTDSTTATTTTQSDYTITNLGMNYIYYRTVSNKGFKSVWSSPQIVNLGVACAYNVGQEWNFTYTGGVQDFTVPCDGLYQLEVWGAQGGTCSYTGGKGAKVSGSIVLANGQLLYVVVGGQGSCRQSSGGTASGGYNGGGYGRCYGDDGNAGSGGGGATHIGFENKQLKETAQSNVLIVAGGGGGIWQFATYNGGNGGSSGSGGSSYGQGGNGGGDNSGGGGGGWLGGRGGSSNGTPGSGGSNYTDSVPEITYKGTVYSPSTTNGANSGNGKAKITLIDY